MPQRARLDYAVLREGLHRYLNERGPSSAKSICAFLRISQPTFSRLLSSLENLTVRAGQGSQTLYALKRKLPTGSDQIPVFKVDETGNASHAATLLPIQPRGYYLESSCETISSRFYEGLPYLFDDLRPAGFLGRLVPRLYPDLEAPSDIRDWKDEHCLDYWARHGWDLIGNFIFGELAFETYLKNKLTPPLPVREEDRATEYPRLADLTMSVGIPGSSAGGEQAKFLTTCLSRGETKPVLIKFSPPMDETIGRRIADLLVCEHAAHETLRAHGIAASHSEVIVAGGRTFLQIDRFDRTVHGRRGLLSLLPLNMQFVGNARSWSETAKELHIQKKIDEATYHRILWLETFGRLIANTDMHLGNVSFLSDGESLLELSPTYDMLPMLYAPQQNQLVEREFTPPLPRVSEAPFWTEALAAAREFWVQVQQHPRISESFKRVTAENEDKLSQLSALSSVLPRT